MQRLHDKHLTTELQILDNEASAEYQATIKQKWNVAFQFVPPDVHQRNATERAIRTFKAHFIAILAGVASDFPKNKWDLLLPQTEMTLNFLRQSKIDPSMSAWDHFNGPFNFDATPLAPIGYPVIIHTKPGI